MPLGEFGPRTKKPYLHLRAIISDLDFSAIVISCAALLWTKVSSFGNLVTKSASTQRGLQTFFPFEYLLPNPV